MRSDGREADQLRPITFKIDFVDYPEGSVLVTQGRTRVLCNVSIDDSVPRWMQAQGVTGGWITGEYALLPRSTHVRTPRETNGLSGRTQEIRRLIGRSLRAAVDLEKLGQRTCIIDCDVLQADGGTRTAAINGGYVALAVALKRLAQAGLIPADTLKTVVGAISVGVIDGESRLDLCYEEDSRAQVDTNVVMTAAGEFIEIQGTAEGDPFPRPVFYRLLDLAQKGIFEILAMQKKAVEETQT